MERVCEFKAGQGNITIWPTICCLTDLLSRVAAVDTKIWQDRIFTITILKLNFPQVSISTIYQIVAENFNFQKMCSRWVNNKLPTENHTKETGMCFGLSHSVRRWGWWYVRTNRKSRWNLDLSHHIWVKTKIDRLASNGISCYGQSLTNAFPAQDDQATVFWERQGNLLVDFIPYGETINTADYCATKTHIRRAIQNKGIPLLHDARPHTISQS